MPTPDPIALPELPSITRYRVDGDIAYPVSEDPDGSMVDYEDHVSAMRAYGQACFAMRAGGGEATWNVAENDVCGACGGGGEITGLIQHPNGDPQDSYWGPLVCPECDGTGDRNNG
jgi:hypothetical protein